MGYEAFKRALQDKIQDCVARPINFTETESVRINETSEGLILKLDGGNTAPLIYPEKLYEDYLAGMPLSMLAADAADIARKTCEYPEIPELTSENAQKSIRLALINKEQKVLSIAERNTESEHYICRNIISVICEAGLAEGTDAGLLDGMDPVSKSPLYVLTNRTGIDGSRAVLSDRFLQEVAHQLGTDDLCLLPSSRNEMLAADIAAVGDIAEVKNVVMQVNRDPRAIRQNNILSDSVYFYNAKTHLLSVYRPTPV